MMRLLISLFTLTLAHPAAAIDLSGEVTASDGKPLANAHVYVYEALPRVGVNTK